MISADSDFSAILAALEASVPPLFFFGSLPCSRPATTSTCSRPFCPHWNLNLSAAAWPCFGEVVSEFANSPFRHSSTQVGSASSHPRIAR